MDPADFKNTAGSLAKDKEDDHYYFVPARLPVSFPIDDELVDLLMQASKALGKLEALAAELSATIGFSSLLFIRPYLRKEAVLSSKIEGTVSTLNDVLRAEAAGVRGEETRGDLLEVLNYIAAQETGVDMIKSGKIVDIEFVKRLHLVLLRRVRGEQGKPGAIREVQNYISRAGLPGIENAVYVPPKASMVPELLENLFAFMSSGSGLPGLIRVALMHYQFEAVHPFLDGNGRIGRLLIIFYLIRLGELSQPFLYMSAYFERNREEYYRLLLEVSTLGRYAEWVKFFMKGVIEQSKSALSKSSKLFEYRKEIAGKLKGNRRASMPKLVDILFTNPIITIPTAARMLGISYPAAKASVYEAVRIGVLQQQESTEGNIRPSMFVAREIIGIYDT